ncbi:uncharacterized protein LOC127262367 [Andrographis paniculata]|uniref:uncharacterized protein LOC127262367 n=1 Tax=Andrographis paniculata TaxID=175694 RepID=UPI0021E99A5B|nr:uncharacterized protein LOC127262367 [Andrographis paniculata]
MSTDGAIVATRAVSCPSAPNSASTSPHQRAKFLCSYGGKILPRPSDGQLKYVGGETRVVSVPRDITYQEFINKLTSMVNGEMVLKYQVMSEDLDALVSVKSDEDLCHMLEEINRYDSAGGPRLRAFLFPLKPVVMESNSLSTTVEPQQRYIDSINGIIHHIPSHITKPHPTLSSVQCSSLASSACTSPRSPDSYNSEATNGELLPPTAHNRNGRTGMQRVRSSPSISSLGAQSQQHGSIHPAQSPYHHHYRQGQNFASYQMPMPKPPIDAHKSIAPDRLFPIRSVGRAEGLKYQVDPVPPHHYYAFRQSRGNGVYTKCTPYDDFTERRRPRSLAGSPNLSPRYGQSGMKAWDSMSMPGREM